MLPKGLRVLIVDDNASDRLIVRAILKKLRAEVIHEAENGSVAEGKLSTAQDMNEPYNLVFLDWNMPNVGGLNLLKNIRSHPKLKSTKVIIMTGSSNHEVVEDAIYAQASDFLVKPVDKDLLEKKLDIMFPGPKNVKP